MNRDSLRIAIATNNLFVGGSQQLVLTHAKAFSDRGHHVSVVDLVGGPDRMAGRPEPMREPIESAGIPIVDFHIRSALDFGEWRRARAWFRAWQPQIVHGHLAPADRWSALLGRSVGARCLTTKHDTYRNLSTHALWAERIAARVLFDRIIAISAATGQHLTEYIGAPPERIITIPNPVDTARFDPDRFDKPTLRDELGLDREAFYVSYVGRLVARKGLKVWLEAASLAANAHPGLHFLIVGDGPDRAELQALASRLGLGDRIRFAGRQSDIPAWLAASDALLFTPLSGEGLPIALLEAMAMALPIVASNLGANRELLETTGLLPEPRAWRFDAQELRPEPFAMALVQLARDPLLGRELGARARDLVARNHAVDVVIEQQIQLYRALLDPATPKSRTT